MPNQPTLTENAMAQNCATVTFLLPLQKVEIATDGLLFSFAEKYHMFWYTQLNGKTFQGQLPLTGFMTTWKKEFDDVKSALTCNLLLEGQKNFSLEVTSPQKQGNNWRIPVVSSLEIPNGSYFSATLILLRTHPADDAQLQALIKKI